AGFARREPPVVAVGHLGFPAGYSAVSLRPLVTDRMHAPQELEHRAAMALAEPSDARYVADHERQSVALVRRIAGGNHEPLFVGQEARMLHAEPLREILAPLTALLADGRRAAGNVPHAPHRAAQHGDVDDLGRQRPIAAQASRHAETLRHLELQ